MLDGNGAASDVPFLDTETSPLREVIAAEVHAAGPIPFRRFMELALYHPDHGYYSAGRCAIGRSGDYFTNVSVGPVFGRLLAVQFADIWDQLGRPAKFTVVEQGAHHGEFAHDVLEALARHAPGLFSLLRYTLVEPFPKLKQRQTESLRDFAGKIDWRDSLEDLDPFCGIHFSNELFDALPVDLLVARPGSDTGWMERRVALENGEFVFVPVEIEDADLRGAAANLPPRPAGYETEIQLSALNLIAVLAGKLERGVVLTIDYGLVRSDFYDESRRAGTLQSRARHRLLPSSFSEIGASDLTTHVEWTSVARQAESRGFVVTGFADQYHFLTALLSRAPAIASDASASTRRGLQTLLHPEMLGRQFQVLALSRGVKPPLVPGGFQFARAPRSALEI